jgi:hypothetical protein
MDMIVLCPCGHPTPVHDERGCRAGRYHPCVCRLDSTMALEIAIANAAWHDESVPEKSPNRPDGALQRRSDLHK